MTARLIANLFALCLLLTLGALACPAAADDGQAETADAIRVALVTGSTRGLGAEVAQRVGAMGYHVIVHGRDSERGQAVVAEIRAAGGSAEFRPADFFELAQVQALADGIRTDFSRLDLLVNNAGIGSPDEPMDLTGDGVEPVLQVNYLAHFLLTEELLPLIRRSAPARIINVSSGAQAPMDFSDPMLEKWESDGSEIGRPYAQSKLAQILHTIDLAEWLDGSGVTVNALHPATFMDTYMVRRAGIEPRTDVAEGADRVMQLITDDVGSGHYFRDGESARAHDQAYHREARRELRRLSQEWIAATR